MGAFVLRDVQDGRQGEPAITRVRKHFSKIHESHCKPLSCLLSVYNAIIMLITLPTRRSDRLSLQLDGQNERQSKCLMKYRNHLAHALRVNERTNAFHKLVQRISLPLKTACCVSRGSLYSKVWQIRDTGHAASSTDLQLTALGLGFLVRDHACVHTYFRVHVRCPRPAFPITE